MLELNFSNMLAGTLGDRGLTERHVEALRPLIAAAHERIEKRSVPGLAFIDLPSQETGELRRLATKVREEMGDFLLLGIGGSALGPRAILEALSPLHNLRARPRIFICDNVDPGTLGLLLSVIDLERTTVNVITKSGSTAETMATFMVLWDELRNAVGDRAPERIIATTDPEHGNLHRIARQEGFRTLQILPSIGGRFSVLSPVGLLLAEVAGIDSNELLRGAADMHRRCAGPEVWENPAYLAGSLLYLMNRDAGRSVTVLIPYADGLRAFAEWFCQLWAESLGKNGIGMTPYPSLGTVDQHSQLQLWMEGPEDKVVMFLRVLDYGTDILIPSVFPDVEGISYLAGHTLGELMRAEEESSELALARNRRPNLTLTVPAVDAFHLGQLFHFFELVTAFTGFLMGVNAFDQPGVEVGKNFTYAMMGKEGFGEKRLEVEKARQQKAGFRI